MKGKAFIEKTRELLGVNEANNRLAKIGFHVIGKGQKGILVFGINPAGDEQRDEDYVDYPMYFNYVPEVYDTNICNTNFHKAIFDALEKAIGANVKWDWCNYSEDDLEKNMGKKIEGDEKEKICKFHEDYKDKDYTIYIGEFFYCHSTSQSYLINLIRKQDTKKHMKEMLNMHIGEIENAGNSVECIYINNATASHWLYEAICNDSKKDFRPASYDYDYNGKTYKIFFGSMLSGQRSMDVFSRNRLITDIKNYLENK